MVPLLLFDFDLTLADSAKPIVDCFYYALKVSNLPVPKEKAILATIGMGLNDAFSILAPAFPPEALLKLFRERADQIMVDWTILYKDIPALVKTLHSSGYRMGIVSAKFRFRVEAILNRENMLQYFDIILGKEDVTKQKPDPEGILKAIGELKCHKDSAIYIGDSAIDGLTAAAAGVKFVGVTTGATSKTELIKVGAMVVIKDLRQLTRNLDKVLFVVGAPRVETRG